MAASLIARNKIQKLFLNDENAKKLSLYLAPLDSHEHLEHYGVEFEVGDWDVDISTSKNKCMCDWSAKQKNSTCDCCYANSDSKWSTIHCTIQPSLGDDYPIVLRKMSKRVDKTHELAVKRRTLEMKETCRLGVRPLPLDRVHYVLLVGSLTTEEITREELSLIFKQKSVTIVYMCDLGL